MQLRGPWKVLKFHYQNTVGTLYVLFACVHHLLPTYPFFFTFPYFSTALLIFCFDIRPLHFQAWCHSIFMARAGHYIFAMWFLLLSIFLFFPRPISAVCPSVAAFPHYCMYQDVSWTNVRGCTLLGYDSITPNAKCCLYSLTCILRPQHV